MKERRRQRDVCPNEALLYVRHLLFVQLKLFLKECQYNLFSHADKACKCALSVLTTLFRYGVLETYAVRTPHFAFVNTVWLLRQTYLSIPLL